MMCGRFAVIKKFEEIASYYGAHTSEGEEWRENYNVAPTQEAPVIVDTEDGREVTLMRWGLIPHWAKDKKIAHSTINARAEGIKDKPAFRDSFKNKRCIVPASGFYEWQKLSSDKRPYYFTPKEGLFSFAGLWSKWLSPEDIWMETFTIITTKANEQIKPIHDRMPVMLGHNSWAAWMDEKTKPSELQEFLVPSTGQIDVKRVSTYVNTPKNCGIKCIEELNSQ